MAAVAVGCTLYLLGKSAFLGVKQAVWWFILADGV